jgi:RNA polymerase sigma-70 factor (ECF subfamily)
MPVTKSRSPHLWRQTADPPDAQDYERLVREAAQGDRDAMERLLMRSQEVAYRFSLLVCGHAHDAEDVMQDALLQTYRRVGKIAHPEAFRTWLFRIVRNACLMKRRRRAGEPAHLQSIDADPSGPATDREAGLDVPDPARGPDDLAANAWLGRRLRDALTHLTPGDRMIVLLREMEGLSTREVAEVTGLSEANVKQRLHRARMRLRAQLGEDV